MQRRSVEFPEVLAQETAPAVLLINTVGAFGLHVGEREIAVAGRKSRALIGYLALTDTLKENRERIVGLLWSESSEEKARGSLRQTIHEIREAFQKSGFAGFEADKIGAGFVRTSIRVDVMEALAAAKKGYPHQFLLAGPNPTDDVLAELETLDPAFRTWLVAKRQTIHDQLTRQLEIALARAIDAAAARDLATALINLDATHEEACRAMIRIHAAQGETGAALKIYKNLWDLLDSEYDVEPTQETQNLIAEIKSALPFNEGGDAMADAGEPLPRKKLAAPVSRTGLGVSSATPRPASVAQASEPKLILSIGTFKLLGGERNHDYMAQGFRREVIACLVRFREWSVRDWAENSAETTVRIPANEFLLDASGYETDDGIHLVLTLRGGTTDAYLWSEALTLTLDKWHQAQQSVVRRIATTLNVHVSAERVDYITQRGSLDLKAYDVWLLGQETLQDLNAERWERAEELFHRVVHRMPHFAPAYSSLAQLNNSYHIVKPGVARDAQRTERALVYAREAVRLDPVDSRSHLCLGWSNAMAKRYEQALIYIPLAYALNQNDRWTCVSAANCFAFCGHPKDAKDILDGLSRDGAFAPSQLEWAYQAAIYFMACDYEHCVAAAEAAGDLNANVRGFKVAALYHLGSKELAAAELQEFITIARTRWASTEASSAEAVMRWFLYMFPIAEPADWARLRDGLRGAGAPVDGLAHHQW